MNYEQDIRIDPDALDIEWLEQAPLMIKYSRYEIEMLKEFDTKKEALEVIKAGLDLDMRNDPTAFGLDKLPKITEAVITNTILEQREYKKANQEYLNAKYEYEMAKKAVKAFEQRKDTLENLVRLHGQQYFAGPSIPRDLSKEWERKEKQKRVDEGIANKLKRSK
jgi:CRISPR/Cas system-associated protein Cas5 (RAMP superfamily)